MPFEIQSLVENLHKDFQTLILTKSYSTPFIPISRGVLQGDCLSPLLFNMIFTTFITSIRSQEFEQLGYKYAQHLSPRHWYQFADDAAIVTGQQYENQILLNAFTRWVSWANMIIRADKCKTFGIQKQGTTAVQFLPKLLTNNSVIPPVKINEQFTYLGRHFNFQVDDEEHESTLVRTCREILTDIDKLPLHPKHKIELYSKYLLSKISKNNNSNNNNDDDDIKTQLFMKYVSMIKSSSVNKTNKIK